MSKKELIDEVLDLESFKNDINSKYLFLMIALMIWMSNIKMVNSNLSISIRRNVIIVARITQLERKNVINAHCNRR